MWQCSKCGTNNDDIYATCLTCGNNRSAGHFAIQSADEEKPDPYYQPVRHNLPLPAVQAQVPVEAKVSLTVRWLHFCGRLLSILLPVLALTLMIVRRSRFMPVILSLFTDQGSALPLWLQWSIYVPFVATICLLLSLPGCMAVAAAEYVRRRSGAKEKPQ